MNTSHEIIKVDSVRTIIENRSPSSQYLSMATMRGISDLTVLHKNAVDANTSLARVPIFTSQLHPPELEYYNQFI